MVKKIGILTLFKSHNYGTFLQCYSLAKELMKYKDLKVEVIDCVTQRAEKSQWLSFRDPNSKIYSLKIFIRYLKLRDLIKKKLPLSKKSLVSNDYEATIDFINRQNYDCIIVGSDEVWKKLSHFPIPNKFWLSEKIKARKFSYAASCNKTNFHLLSDKDREFMSNKLRNFEYLGARDNTTIEQLAKIDNSLCFHKNPDPAFMYEFEETPNLKNKLIKKYKLNFDKPIIATTIRDIRVSKALLEKFGSEYEIVSIFRSNKYIKKYILDLDYFEWARVFSYFSGVVTDLFHGTIFSIKNGTPFVSVDDMDNYLNYPGKIEDLLTGIELQDNYFNMKSNNFNMNLMLERLQYNMQTRNEQQVIMKQIHEYKKNEAKSHIAEIVEMITNPKCQELTKNH